MPVDLGTDIAYDAKSRDIDGLGGISTGGRVVAEALARRLITPLGRLLDDPNYGFDVTSYINDDLDSAGIAAIQAGVRQECLKDERVLDVSVVATFLNSILTVTIGFITGAGPFSLVLAVSSTSATILSVS